MAQMSARIHRRAESGEVLRLEPFEDARIDVHALGGLQQGQAFFLARSPQPRSNTGACIARFRHGNQPGLCSISASAFAWGEVGKSRRNLREYSTKATRSFCPLATCTPNNNRSGVS